jgi:hypothetical protein
MLEMAWEDFLWFVDQALDAMVGIVEVLGDDLANRQPDLEGANSPFAILTHCLGVMEFWAGTASLGRASERDRAAEFVTRGEVADLVERVQKSRRQLALDLEACHSLEPPALSGAADEQAPFWRTQGAALFHIYEELAQHLGQMELTRDVLVAEQRG